MRGGGGDGDDDGTSSPGSSPATRRSGIRVARWRRRGATAATRQVRGRGPLPEANPQGLWGTGPRKAGGLAKSVLRWSRPGHPAPAVMVRLGGQLSGPCPALSQAPRGRGTPSPPPMAWPRPPHPTNLLPTPTSFLARPRPSLPNSPRSSYPSPAPGRGRYPTPSPYIPRLSWGGGGVIHSLPTPLSHRPYYPTPSAALGFLEVVQPGRRAWTLKSGKSRLNLSDLGQVI